MTATRRTNMVLTDHDESNIKAIRDEYRIASKIGAVRYALGIVRMIVDGDARLIDKNGKPVRTVNTG